jgi:hypothetical protein
MATGERRDVSVEVMQFLRPNSYPHRVSRVEVIETHWRHKSSRHDELIRTSRQCVAGYKVCNTFGCVLPAP